MKSQQLDIKTKFFTYEEYLKHEFELEGNYELEAGKIIEMPPESYQNVRIALILMMLIAEKIGIDRISNKAEIIISGSKTNARIPDITVFSETGVEEIKLKNTSTIDLNMSPPILVIEIVSPGKTARDHPSGTLRDRDYRFKRSEYAARGIENYWIIDPLEQNITFLILEDGLYVSKNLVKNRIINIDSPVNLVIDLQTLFPSNN
ncbi:MAG: Uma2 family endonuclease [Waterburya sp.]